MKHPISIAIVLGGLLYFGDYFSLRWRIPGRPQFGSVLVQRYYAVPLKDHKTEYMFDQPANQTCVHSLLPHYGYLPCWYLTGHRRQEIKTG
jgi:hypothetical protein